MAEPFSQKVSLTDRIMQMMFLHFIPRSVTPNAVTVFRIVVTPYPLAATLLIGSVVVVLVMRALSFSLGVTLLLSVLITEWLPLFPSSKVTFLLAIIFGLVSLVTYGA